ncbi:hypothetical protein D3C71_250090 [compost metagenome]
MPLFHGTSTARLEQIGEQGLVPQASHDNGDRVCVYLAADRSVAEIYADLACVRRGGEPIILEVDEELLDPAYFQPDDYDLQNCIDDLHDPEREDEIGMLSGIEVDERLRPYRRWQDVPVRLSLAVTAQAAYLATVPLSAIAGMPEPGFRACS